MSKEYDLTFQDREEAHFGLDKLLVPKARLEDRLAFLERRRNRQPAGDWQHKEENNVHTLRNRLDFVARVEDALAEVADPDPAEPLAEDVEA